MKDQRHHIQQLNRRQFLKLTGIASSGLMLGITSGCSDLSPQNTNKEFSPNAFLTVTADNRITVYVHKPEMGQGINTAFAMIIADEMDAAWQNIKVTAAPIDPARFGSQEAVASRSILITWTLLRRAGATARSMLLAAAADQLDVDTSDLTVSDSYITHSASGRKRSFGELSLAAANRRKPIKYFLTLKSPQEYKLLGTSIPSLDAASIVRGEQQFSIDHELPSMRYAVYAKSPKRGASLVKANLAQVKKLPGVLEVIAIDGNNNLEGLCPGVAIIATDTWSALQARTKLVTSWAGNGATDSWSRARLNALDLSKVDGPIKLAQQGNAEQTLTSSQTQVTATYQYSFVNHAQLEPLCCTAWLHDQQLDLWCASQSPQGAREQAAELAGLTNDQVNLHQLRGGGAFGRRLYHDIVLEATAIAKHSQYPIKLIRSREDDMHSDLHRSGGFHHLQAGLNEQNQLQTWRNHFISFTNNGNNGVRGGSMTATEFPIPLVANTNVTQSLLDWRTPVGFCRAPGANVFAFVIQSFLGELSSKAGIDHLEFLLKILGKPRWLDKGNADSLNTGRAAKVLSEAARLGGWGSPLPSGQGLGLAFHFSHGGYFAEVAKVSVGENKGLQVEEVSVVGDVGPIINLSGALAQCEGSVMDGLSILLGQKITLEDGVSQQTNFDQYPVLRIGQAPKIKIKFLQTWDSPSGLGEPALPPLAPAVGNAIFAASGHRVRTLPFSEEGYTSA